MVCRFTPQGMLDHVDFSVGYREWAPPAALRDVLACLWIRVVPGTGSAGAGPGAGPGGGGPRTGLVLPDGCTDLIWERGRGAFVAGPDTGPAPTALAPGTVFAGVRFRPGAGGDALGLPLSELRDLRVDLADVRRDVARQLPASLEPADAVRALAAVAGRLAAERPPDVAMLQAGRLLGRPGVRAEDVASPGGPERPPVPAPLRGGGRLRAEDAPAGAAFPPVRLAGRHPRLGRL